MNEGFNPSTLHRRHPLLGLAVCLILTFIVAGLGALASSRAAPFYQSLVRPDWAPPAWLFGPVWTVLYILMAFAAWLVWREHGLKNARVALGLFVVQLLFNGLWTWIFFTWQQGALAFAEIQLLWALIFGTLVAFWRLHRLASFLLMPYLAWVSFACALSFSMWQLNPTVLG